MTAEEKEKIEQKISAEETALDKYYLSFAGLLVAEAVCFIGGLAVEIFLWLFADGPYYAFPLLLFLGLIIGLIYCFFHWPILTILALVYVISSYLLHDKVKYARQKMWKKAKSTSANIKYLQSRLEEEN